MTELKAIEVAELSVIKVNGTVGSNIIQASKECLQIAELLKVCVELYWNGKFIMIYRTDTVQSIIDKSLNNPSAKEI